MKIHEAAMIIPEMSEEEYQSLKEDIKANGLIHPIETFDGEILDGRHRERACRELGIEPAYHEVHPESPTSYVLSANVERRQLTIGQRAMIALAAEAQFAKERPKPKRGKGGKFTGSVAGDAPGRSAKKAGELVGVGETSVRAAKKLAEHDPDLAEQVRTGKKDLTPAYNELVARTRKENEQAHIQKIIDENPEPPVRGQGLPAHSETAQTIALEQYRQRFVKLSRDIRRLARDYVTLPADEDAQHTFLEAIENILGDVQLLKDVVSGSKDIDDELRTMLGDE